MNNGRSDRSVLGCLPCPGRRVLWWRRVSPGCALETKGRLAAPSLFASRWACVPCLRVACPSPLSLACFWCTAFPTLQVLYLRPCSPTVAASGPAMKQNKYSDCFGGNEVFIKSIHTFGITAYYFSCECNQHGYICIFYIFKLLFSLFWREVLAAILLIFQNWKTVIGWTVTYS